jgi:predicted GNAT superfamily acetyltransferase
MRLLDDPVDLQAVANLLARIWGTDPKSPPVTAHMLRALVHADNYLAGAWRGDRLIGASLAFLGFARTRVVLHSHITGVSDESQGRQVGFALKQHQRAWALDHGLDEITRTFDPLVRRNGRFNLNKLRAHIVDYRVNFYGDMDDGINQGDPSDRCLVEWSLVDPEVVRASLGESPVESDGRSEGVVILAANNDGRPVMTDAEGDELRAWVPTDIVAMRRSDPDLARQWRLALRETFGVALTSGYQAVHMSADGWYSLARRQPSEEPS